MTALDAFQWLRLWHDVRVELKRKHFAPGQEPEVLASVSSQCSALNCESCPGLFRRDDHPGRIIACVHECHNKRNMDKA
jgi:hypothetical protein